MIILLTAIHVLICLFLVMVVLLQSGKAADLAGAFGGMGSQTAFGPRGSATVLSKATTIAAAMFMVTSLSLAIMSTRQGGAAKTVLETKEAKEVKPPTGPIQPQVTITPEGSESSITVPLDIPERPPQQGQQPAPGTQPAPPKP